LSLPLPLLQDTVWNFWNILFSSMCFAFVICFVSIGEWSRIFDVHQLYYTHKYMFCKYPKLPRGQQSQHTKYWISKIRVTRASFLRALHTVREQVIDWIIFSNKIVFPYIQRERERGKRDFSRTKAQPIFPASVAYYFETLVE
jgi:hypothetical protein